MNLCRKLNATLETTLKCQERHNIPPGHKTQNPKIQRMRSLTFGDSNRAVAPNNDFYSPIQLKADAKHNQLVNA